MNRKFIFNIAFFAAGTFIVIMICTIVLLNFFKDARIFQKNAVAVETVKENTVQEKKEQPQEEKQDANQEQTVKFQKRDYGEKETEPRDNTDYGEDIPKKKIRVEIVNYTGNAKIANEVASTLKAGGFEVSVTELKPDPEKKTVIIERNDRKAGSAVLDILKAGKVIKAPDPKSKYDVTLSIGDDYRP